MTNKKTFGILKFFFVEKKERRFRLKIRTIQYNSMGERKKNDLKKRKPGFPSLLASREIEYTNII